VSTDWNTISCVLQYNLITYHQMILGLISKQVLVPSCWKKPQTISHSPWHVILQSTSLPTHLTNFHISWPLQKPYIIHMAKKSAKFNSVGKCSSHKSKKASRLML